MIVQSLWVLLFGMAGIFIVMLIIMGALVLMHRFSKEGKKGKPEA